MISSAFRLVFSVTLNFSKVRSLVMRGKVDYDLFIIAGQPLLVLLDTSFDDNIHVVISISLRVYLFAGLELLKRTVIEYLPFFLYVK